MDGEVPDEPEESFGCGVLLVFELVDNKVLYRFGDGGGSQLAVTDFLRQVSFCLPML